MLDTRGRAAAFESFLPVPSASCSAELGRFFTEWWDTVYPPRGGANRPQITAAGLGGEGFHC